MNIAVFAITKNGIDLAAKVSRHLQQAGHQVRMFRPARFPGKGEPFTGPVSRVVAEEFYRCQGLVFIMALGIVVRLLAPLVRDKRSDPAVVVMDERGQFVISTLSGHLGGANELAQQLAGALQAVPVITTATDVHGLPAVDVLARKYDLSMEPFTAVKQVNAALVNGETVTLCSEPLLPLTQTPGLRLIPWEDLPATRPQGWLVVITNRVLSLPHEKTLFLRPRNLVAGMGCRREAAPERVRQALFHALELARRSPASLRALATVDLRAQERGLQLVAREMDIPLFSFTREQIRSIFTQKPSLHYSSFVQEKIGVGGVCEPVALLAAAPQAKLILPKTSWEGVTVALAEESYGWWERGREV
ncbi:cobalt-precorrin 5A hydrolase [Desulfofundulus salinus]|uniref:Cobalamin biosynthesis protein CbiG n=1 Tax=Desulfofundulus salinus TaxID=2419843 RepID=A0A494X2J5_9FIRM|nr:cobalt-precorrin 5A hydrolase [Desulfofundulus salinum]RKO67130.1 cobalamin biosynthesis protein CbiG [Desulfofundulus salinum]